MERARSRPSVLVVLSSLCAEGTPVMALDLCNEWLRAGIVPNVLTLFDEPAELRAEYAASGLGVVSAGIGRSGWSRYARIIGTVRELARRIRPRAVLSMPFGWHAFVLAGARLAGVRVTAAHVGNYPARRAGTAFAKFRAEVALGRLVTDRLICCSAYVRGGVRDHFGVPDRVTTVVHNGCDVDGIARRAADARARRLTGERLRIGMVARLEGHKDHPTLLHAFARLSREIRAELWLIGDGSRRSELQALAESLGIAGAVRFLGARRDVPELLGSLDVFAFAAKPDEGLGIALTEAMAAGVPIVATDVGACREVLEDGRLGRLARAADPEALASALIEVAARTTDVRSRADRAQARAREAFSREQMAAGYARELGLLPVA